MNNFPCKINTTLHWFWNRIIYPQLVAYHWIISVNTEILDVAETGKQTSKKWQKGWNQRLNLNGYKFVINSINKLKFVWYDTIDYDCFLLVFGDKYACVYGAEKQIHQVQQSASKKRFDR